MPGCTPVSTTGPGPCSGDGSPPSCSASRRPAVSDPPPVPERPAAHGATRARIVLVRGEEERVAERDGGPAARGGPGPHDPPLHIVPGREFYADLEELYGDKVLR